jgi:hypothetical protein
MMHGAMDQTPASGGTAPEWSRRDVRYRRVSRALAGAIVLSAAFCLYIFFAKEVRPLYVTEPWQDDPYDALISFEFIALPVLTVLAAWRSLLSTASTTAPLQRIIDLARTCYVITGLIVLTICAEWFSVIGRTHSADWTAATSGVISVLGILTAATIVVAALLNIARGTLRGAPAPGKPDWIGDGIYFLRLTGRATGPVGRPIRAVADWTDRVASAWIRRYPLTFLACVATLLALLGGGKQIINEDYDPGFAIYFLTVTSTSYYAFFAIASRYLNFISIAPLRDHPARLVVLTTAASIHLTAAFRQYLDWIIGIHGAIGTPAQLYLLTAVIAIATAAVTLIITLIIKPRATAKVT